MVVQIFQVLCVPSKLLTNQAKHYLTKVSKKQAVQSQVMPLAKNARKEKKKKEKKKKEKKNNS